MCGFVAGVPRLVVHSGEEGDVQQEYMGVGVCVIESRRGGGSCREQCAEYDTNKQARRMQQQSCMGEGRVG